MQGCVDNGSNMLHDVSNDEKAINHFLFWFSDITQLGASMICLFHLSVWSYTWF